MQVGSCKFGCVISRASWLVQVWLCDFSRKLARASLAVRFLAQVGSCKLGSAMNCCTWLAQVGSRKFGGATKYCASCKFGGAIFLVQVGTRKFGCAQVVLCKFFCRASSRASWLVQDWLRDFSRKLARACLTVRFLAQVGSCKCGGPVMKVGTCNFGCAIFLAQVGARVWLRDFSCKLARESLAVWFLAQVGARKLWLCNFSRKLAGASLAARSFSWESARASLAGRQIVAQVGLRKCVCTIFPAQVGACKFGGAISRTSLAV